MEQKELNLCEILKGYENEVFYSPIWGDTKIVGVDSVGEIGIIPSNQKHNQSTKLDDKGRMNPNGEPMLFPSKELREAYTFEGAWHKWAVKHNRVTYNDVCMDLFKEYFYNINIDGDIWRYKSNADKNMCISATSRKQLEKLFAINKLMNVQKWLEKGWQPDWKNRDMAKWYIFIEDDMLIAEESNWHCGDIYFSSKVNAEKAIEILGEDVIRQALSTDW